MSASRVETGDDDDEALDGALASINDSDTP